MLFQTFKNEKVWIVARNIVILPVSAHLTCMFSSQAGLWTVFTLGGVGSKAATTPALSSPLANQSLLLLLVLANLTDAADAPNPYRQAIISFKNTQGLWGSLSVLPNEERGCCLPRIVHCLIVVEMTVQYIFILIHDENSLDFPACILRKVR